MSFSANYYWIENVRHKKLTFFIIVKNNKKKEKVCLHALSVMARDLKKIVFHSSQFFLLNSAYSYSWILLFFMGQIIGILEWNLGFEKNLYTSLNTHSHAAAKNTLRNKRKKKKSWASSRFLSFSHLRINNSIPIKILHLWCSSSYFFTYIYRIYVWW